jgi:PAS domain S-box-containing protein
LESNPGVVQEGIFDCFREVTETGIPRQDERHYVHEQFDGWFIQSVVRLGDGVATTTKDITAWKKAQEELLALRDAMVQTRLHESEERLRQLIEGIPQLVWRASGNGQWTWASPQWTRYTRLTDEESRQEGWLKAVYEADRHRVRQAWAEAEKTGEFRSDYRLFHAAEGRHRWFQTRATPVRDASGRIIEWLGTSTDVDDLRGLETRQRLLVAELQHRVRNILTVVRSVFGRTAEASEDLDHVVDHFRGRLDSLARTQVVVTQSATGMVDLESLVRDELLSVGAGDGPYLRITGPDVKLQSKAAEMLGLAVHELTTNALKYGALSTAKGKIDILWSVNSGYGGEDRLDFIWEEQGVPAISLPPSRRGFGRELIEDALPYSLAAKTELQFRGGGIRCVISLPLRDPERAASDQE